MALDTHTKTASRKATHPGKYAEGIGRRKTAIARVRCREGKGPLIVNGKEMKQYFQLAGLERIAIAPLEELKITGSYAVESKVRGGGPHAQAEAVRHGLSRALVNLNEDYKKRLRKLGFLTRDPRMVERKKYGLKKARRAPQWAKR